MTALGFDDGIPPNTISQLVAYVILWALETRMRAGEICALEPGDVTETVAVVRASKSGAGKTASAKRRVPLTTYAREIANIARSHPNKSGTLFGVTTSQVDSIFRKARDGCGIVDLHFHDSRHTAVTRLARIVHILDLARMIGHANVKQLMIYYNKSAEDVAMTLGNGKP